MASRPPQGEREVVREPEREVVRDPAPAGGGGGPFGVIAAIVGVILVVLLIFFLINNLDLGSGTDTETTPDTGVEAPDELDVDADVNLDGPDAGTDGGGPEVDTGTEGESAP